MGHQAGIWYRPAYQGTTVVYIVYEIEPGAVTEVEFEEYRGRNRFELGYQMAREVSAWKKTPFESWSIQ